MIDFAIETIAEVVGGALELLLDDVFGRLASGRRVRWEKRQKAKLEKNRRKKICP